MYFERKAFRLVFATRSMVIKFIDVGKNVIFHTTLSIHIVDMYIPA